MSCIINVTVDIYRAVEMFQYPHATPPNKQDRVLSDEFIDPNRMESVGTSDDAMRKNEDANIKEEAKFKL